MKLKFLYLIFFISILGCISGSPIRYRELKGGYPKTDWEARNAEASKILSDLLKINTVRGNEGQAVQYLQKIFAKEGIPTRTIVPPNQPNRPNLIAELKATIPNPLPGIVLVNHLDTVEFDAKEWGEPPTSGLIKDGRIYGRGAIDMKGMAVMELMAILEIKRSGVPRSRNIMFLSLADEESGSVFGGQFITKNHAKEFQGYEYAINEGGVASRDIVIPGSTIFNIQYAEKGNLWIRAKATDLGGHGSTPPKDYAAIKLMNFFRDVREWDNGIRITDETEAFFYQLGTISNFPNSFFLKNAGNPFIKPLLSGTIRSNRHLTAMTTNTKSVTGLMTTEGDKGENVIASTAYGKLDLRLLPGTDPDKVFAQLKEIAAPYNIELTVTDSNPADSTPIDTPLFQTMASVAKSKFEKSTVTPFLSPGKTDSSYMRRIGIKCYGLIPAVLKAEDIDTMHGKNENISVENLKLGSQILTEVLWESNAQDQ